jgi:DnaJ family protein C protein 28
MSNLSKEERERLEKLPEKLNDYRHPGDKPSRGDSVRREAERQSLVEQRIQEAMENGAFDNLPGAGKPLNLNQNPYAEPGQEWALGLLKRNGFAPEWIERDKLIRRDIETARERLRVAWEWHQANPGEAAAWQLTLEQFSARLEKINRQINDFNLVAPSLSVQRRPLRLEAELRRLQNPNRETE